MQCPLPIDWLEYLEGARSEELTSHLPECRSCQILVDDLQRDLRPQLRLSQLPSADSWPQWLETQETSAAFGQIWWTTDLPPTAKERMARAPVLVMTDMWQEKDRSWCDVVPLFTDIENATSLDLVLLRIDTDLGVPWRTLLRYQTVVEMEELDARIGELTDSGRNLVRHVLAGGAAEERLGSQIEGPYDTRVRLPRSTEASVRLLGRRYALVLEPEDALGKQSRILSYEMRRSVRSEAEGTERLSLAADSTEREEEYLWVAKVPDRGHFKGAVEYRLNDDQLLFVIEDVEEEAAGFPSSAWITLWSSLLSESITSKRFLPRVGESVSLARDLGVLPPEISRLELRLSDED